MLLFAHTALAATLRFADPVPATKDVKAGWTAFVIFLLMFLAVVGLGFSMARQFRRVKRNRDAGVLPADRSDAVVHAPIGNSSDQ